ncbi:MAG: glycosyltransferase family 39 protein [Phycisphaerales bacterium]|nr:glycosyltransferase family 39 protein [Phycisphaerales bacterium]
MHARWWLTPLVAFLAVTLPHLGDGDWMRGDTGWYVAIAKQAWDSGSFWTLAGEPGVAYFNKPPLAFWLHGLFVELLGANAYGARLPTVLVGACCVLMTAWLARAWATRSAGLWAGLGLALTYEFFRRVREMSLDMWQLLWLLAALCFATLAVRGAPGHSGQRRGAWMLACGAMVGLALLTKPLMGLLVLPVLGAWLSWDRDWKMLRWLVAGSIVALGVGASWHLSMWSMHNEAFTSQYFGRQIADRAAGDSGVLDEQRTSPAFYLGLLFTTTWPWMLFAILAIVTLARRVPLARDPRGARLALAWLVAWLIVLSVFPDRRPRYGVVLYPAVAWLGALWLTRWPWAWLRPVSRGAAKWAAPAVACVGVALAALPINVQRGPNPQWDAFDAWYSAAGEPELWQGDFDGARGARLYLTHGRWPTTTHDRAGRAIAEPPEGTLVIDHARDAGSAWTDAPRIGEIVFEAGDLRVTRIANDHP